jgi:hypothetical protein
MKTKLLLSTLTLGLLAGTGLLRADGGAVAEYRYHLMATTGLQEAVFDKEGKETTIVFSRASNPEARFLLEKLVELDGINGTKGKEDWDGAPYEQAILLHGKLDPKVQRTPTVPDGSSIEEYHEFVLEEVKVRFPLARSQPGEVFDTAYLETHFGYETLFPKGLEFEGRKIDLDKHTVKAAPDGAARPAAEAKGAGKGASPETPYEVYTADIQRAEAKYRAGEAELFRKADRVVVYLLDFDGLKDDAALSDDEQWISVAPYSAHTKILDTKELEEKDRKPLLEALCTQIALPQHGGGAACHFPIHGIRVYQGENVLYTGTFCWVCHNFGFRYPQSTGWLDTTPELKEIFTTLMPIPQKELDRFQEKYPAALDGRPTAKPRPSAEANPPAPK